jgi:hypothetical protein
MRTWLRFSKGSVWLVECAKFTCYMNNGHYLYGMGLNVNIYYVYRVSTSAVELKARRSLHADFTLGLLA